jgi:hypothetical protein
MCVICRNFVNEDLCSKCETIRRLESEIKENQLSDDHISALKDLIFSASRHYSCVNTSTTLYFYYCPNLIEIKDLPSRVNKIRVLHCPKLERIISTDLIEVSCQHCPNLIEINTPNAINLNCCICPNILEPPIFNNIGIYDMENYTNYYLTVENRLKVAIVKKAIRNTERIIRYKKYFKSREFIEWSHDPNRLGGRLIKSQLANFVKSIC